MAREKDVNMPRRGNFKGGFGQSSATGGAKKKKTPVGMGAKPKPKPAKPKLGAGAKPKPKPAMPAKSGAARSTKNKVAPKKPQSRSVSTGPEARKNWGMTRAMSENSVTRMRKPLKTGARSSRTSGTGYKEGSFMDRMTRAVRRNVYGKK